MICPIYLLFICDFRINEDDLHTYKDLHNESGDVIKIDTLYVDTEFQSIEYADFPKRSECVEYAIIEIKKWLRKSERRQVALHVSAEYGYEYIFNVIYKELGLKVFVNENSWELYRQVPNLVPGVTNDPNTRIHLCNNRHESVSHENCMNTKQDDSDTSKDSNKNHSAVGNSSRNDSLTENVDVSKNYSTKESLIENDSTVGKSSENDSTIENIIVDDNHFAAGNIIENDFTAENTTKNVSTTENGSSAENLSKSHCIEENVSENHSVTGNSIKTDSTNKTHENNSSSVNKNELRKAYLYMHFSARKWKNYIEGDKMYYTDYKANRTDVCYATHCSRNELIYFVNYLSPKKVVGFRDPYVGPVIGKICY